MICRRTASDNACACIHYLCSKRTYLICFEHNLWDSCWIAQMELSCWRRTNWISDQYFVYYIVLRRPTNCPHDVTIHEVWRRKVTKCNISHVLAYLLLIVRSYFIDSDCLIVSNWTRFLYENVLSSRRTRDDTINKLVRNTNSIGAASYV